MKHIFLVFSGIDGCGKSSILNGVKDFISGKGIKTSDHWLRFHHVLCKPLHLIARYIGLVRKQNMTEGGEWRHEFYRSTGFCKIYLWTTYFDTVSGKRKVLRTAEKEQCEVVICDRWIPDILIDLAVKCRNPEILRGVWAKRFLKLLPEDTLLFCITRPKQALLDCRSENREDVDFDFRLQQYEAWNNLNHSICIDNSGSLEKAIRDAQEKAWKFVQEKLQ